MTAITLRMFSERAGAWCARGRAAGQPAASHRRINHLTLAIATINSWNRLAISARSVPGKYQPARSHEAKKSA
jgi:hypothetical protein